MTTPAAKEETPEIDPRDMTDDELRAEIKALESRLYTLKAEGAKIWRLRLIYVNQSPAAVLVPDQL